jgi:hypothetical protein
MARDYTKIMGRLGVGEIEKKHKLTLKADTATRRILCLKSRV